MYDIEQIQKIIPHRYPFLLVDKILENDPGVRAVGIKNVSFNEHFFQGHFPEYAVMPGVLIIEALAQVGGVCMLSKEEFKGKLALFAGIDNLRIRKQVRPGDTLELAIEIIRLKGRIGKGAGVAKVDGQVCVEGELIFAIQDAKE